MTKKISTTKQGFTIIEVVLVLAIAGLIFLMVFVAFPALQRNQRDTQRRQDYANIASGVISSAASNGGNFPSTVAATTANVDGLDPDGTGYTITPTNTRTVPTLSAGAVFVIEKATCTQDSGSFTEASAGKSFIVYGYLENGSYCGEYHL